MQSKFDFFTERGWRIYQDRETGQHSLVTVISAPSSSYYDMAEFKAMNPTFELAYDQGQWVLLIVKE